MSYEYRGDEFVFAAMLPDGSGSDVMMRAFNQTDGGSSVDVDTIDVNTKDKSGARPGNKSETASFQGDLTQDDPFIPAMKEKVRGREMVTIYKINTKTLEAEKGSYVVTKFEESYSDGDIATYSLEGTLDGDVTAETLTQVPVGAQ